MVALEPRLWLEHDNAPHQRHPTVSRFVKVSSRPTYVHNLEYEIHLGYI